jgi:tRNA pseudouridine38-40 synthase
LRYFIHLGYLGSHYHGWQRQKNTSQCIQQYIENAFLKITKREVSIVGCGRTDTGVHAIQYFAHFDFTSEISPDLIQKLNWYLPNDIAIYEIIQVSSNAHARFDAIERSYEYHLHLEKNSQLSNISTYYDILALDFEAIENGLLHIKKLEDFRHLCLTPEKFNNTRCTIFATHLQISDDGKRVCFKFTANRFLKSMIRMIVARLLALGLGKISLEMFKDIHITNQKIKFHTLAYPQGLHLTKIIYPYLQRDIKTGSLLK